METSVSVIFTWLFQLSFADIFAVIFINNIIDGVCFCLGSQSSLFISLFFQMFIHTFFGFFRSWYHDCFMYKQKS